jgi:hypothetical protein
MEKPIYQHLTEVTHECSDTKPVLFILQENILYLEMGTLGPFFVPRSSTSRVASFCYVVCNYCKQRYIEYEGVDYPPSLDQLYGRSESRWRRIPIILCLVIGLKGIFWFTLANQKTEVFFRLDINDSLVHRWYHSPLKCSIEEKRQILHRNQDNVSDLGNMYIPGKLAL